MISEEFGQLFTRAGCQGWLLAADIDGGGEVSAGGDELAVAASVFKVAVALEVFTQAATGRLDPGKRIRVSPAERTPRPTGLSVFADDADLSVRDLAMMMLTVSDNAATDILIDLAGLDAIHAALASLGLRRTIIPGRLKDEFDSIGQDAGFAGWADLEHERQPARRHPQRSRHDHHARRPPIRYRRLHAGRPPLPQRARDQRRHRDRSSPGSRVPPPPLTQERDLAHTTQSLRITVPAIVSRPQPS
jgi:hypothetical protein